jgi:hypothetical protein
MTDSIFIKGVLIHARHGLLEHESEVGQRFVIDLELDTDLSESSRTDKLSDTVSYSNVVATATSAFKDTNYKLLERAARADRRDFRGCRRGADPHPAALRQTDGQRAHCSRWQCRRRQGAIRCRRRCHLPAGAGDADGTFR